MNKRPIIVRGHKQLQLARKLTFCYLCGRDLADATTNRDHVPPKSIFTKVDHVDPLILPTHVTCQNQASAWDQLTGDFVSLRHGDLRTREKLPKNIVVVSEERELVGIQIPLQHVVIRYVQAFHAALYKEHLPWADKRFVVEVPFPQFRSSGGDDGLIPTQPASSVIVEVLKKNRIAGTVDALECYGGSCRYICVWSELDNGEPCCLFGFSLYDWEELADHRSPRRSTVGLYRTASVPPEATRETLLEIPFSNTHPLDPFRN